MPQTLLAIAAITAAGFLTLSQSRSVHGTTESVMRDQFELAVAGTLLHTLEFADARAFDEATTPGALRARFGLPDSMTAEERDAISFDDFAGLPASVFSDVGEFGGEECNVQEPWESPDCDDVDDIDGGAWQRVEFETPDGHPLPVEVRASVVYVDAEAPDVPIPGPTFHKRIEVSARTTAFEGLDGGVSRPLEVKLRRVISFDPAVAAEYVRRSIHLKDGPSCVGAGPWRSDLGRLEEALAQARAMQATTASPLAGLRAALATSEAGLASARGALTAAVAARDAAQRDVLAAQSALTAAQDALTAADAPLDAAQSALTAAEAASTAARSRSDAAQGAAATARATARDARETRDAAYATAVDLYVTGTYVARDGNRYWRSYAARDAFYAAADRYYDARDAADAAEAAVVEAEAVAGSAAADAARAEAAAATAQSAYDDAVATAAAARDAANAAIDRAEADHAAAVAARTAAAAVVSAQTAAVAQAEAAAAADRAALDDAEAAATAVDDQVAAAQAALDAHRAARPACA